MLDRTDFASWQQRIRLYCQGKENEVNILKSIDEAPFRMGTLRETLTGGTEGALHLGPKRPRVYSNLTSKEKERVVIQNVQGRQNKEQGNNAQGAGAASYGGARNIVGYANPGQARQVKCYNCNGIGHLENGVALDEEQLLFITGGQDNIVDEDVDEQPVQDLALNVDNMFQADDCDALDSDVDEAPTTQTMFMANLSSADPVYDEAGPSYDSDILSEVHDHDHYQEAVCEHHEVHEMHDDVQPNYVVVSHVDYTSDSNMIPYDQYPAQHVFVTIQNNVVDKSLTAELATYKEQAQLYERQARFELTEREQKIDEQLRIVITDYSVIPKLLAPGMYAINVKPIIPLLRNNREVHLDYLKHLKESVETLREIVEKAKVERPLDRSLASACLYTKQSQELLEYVIGTCPKDFNKRGDRLWLRNFIKKFIGTVRFRNGHFGAIMGYGDYVIGDSVISRVYYVEGLGHNLFSVRQFCDSDMEVAFRKHSCYVRDTDGIELIKGSRGSNRYTISIEDMMKSSLICLLSKASKTKSWLWHRP
nr:integrase, catalytic region, zinc finger, CCHC-type, peptidase aspartic, catalytic [Tanacetum cinerariifolium]